MKINEWETIDDYILHLAECWKSHARDNSIYISMEERLKTIMASSSLVDGKSGRITMGNFGEIALPFFSMGNINSTHLFGLDELILFALYRSKKDSYKNVADVGANIGLHSIVMSKNGWQVDAYEPDKEHLKRLRENLVMNEVENVSVISKAVSNFNGEKEFIRILGNTTGSHLVGAKDAPYGKLEKYEVAVIDFMEIMNNYDLVKFDVEGEEANFFCSTSNQNWSTTDAVAEVGSALNAKRIFQHAKTENIRIFSQKINWGLVQSLEDMPFSHREGSIFITVNKAQVFDQ